jgi:hypothetical protein
VARLTAPNTAATGSRMPDTAYVLVPGLAARTARRLAERAAKMAATGAPKLSGASAAGIKPYWGDGFFGVTWADPQIWYQEAGTKGRVMRELAGKTIPMWLNDPTGALRRDNPKAKTRVTADGRRQVLIFRKAAKIGARKLARRRGSDRMADVPSSYPGAPGRIGSPRGKGGQIASNPRSGGVRWRHPGLPGRGFVQRAVLDSARLGGLGSPQVRVKARGG